MWKVIKQLLEIKHERALARKACRQLVDQSWSVEFLVYLLCKARDLNRKNISIELRKKDGTVLIIHADSKEQVLVQREKDLDIREEGVTLEALLDAAEAKGILG